MANKSFQTILQIQVIKKNAFRNPHSKKPVLKTALKLTACAPPPSKKISTQTPGFIQGETLSLKVITTSRAVSRDLNSSGAAWSNY